MMSNDVGQLSGVLWGLAFAALLGAAAAVALIVVGGWEFSPAGFVGILVAVVVAGLIALISRPLPSFGDADREAQARAPHVAALNAAAMDADGGPGAVASTAADMPGPAPAVVAQQPLLAAAPAVAGPAVPMPTVPMPAATMPAVPMPAATIPAATIPAAELWSAMPAGALLAESRPTGLSGPRGGTGDNLQEIEGIGPSLEKLCHDLGIFHFDQIAGWGGAETAWMDSNLRGFRGRVTRDKWVPQARLIVAEGNYLLLNAAPWSALARFFALTVLVDIPEAVLRDRLTRRWQGFGLPPAAVTRVRVI